MRTLDPLKLILNIPRYGNLRLAKHEHLTKSDKREKEVYTKSASFFFNYSFKPKL